MKTRTVRRFGAGASLTMAAVIVVGCAGNSGPAEEFLVDGDLVLDGETIADEELLAAAHEEPGPLMLYITTPEDALAPVREAFTEATGIETEHVRLPAARLYERVMSEFGGGVLEADIIDQTDHILTQNMVDDGVLVQHQIPEDWDVPEIFVDPNGYWYAPWTPILTIGYNTALVDEADVPTSWADLVDEQFAGKIGTTPAGVGASTWTLMYFLREEHGIEYWEDYAALDPVIHSSGVPLSEELVRGEIAIAPTILNLLITAKNNGEPVEWVYPEEGVTTFPALMGISSTGKNPDSAAIWMNFVMSEYGSAQSALSMGEVTARNSPVEGYDLPTELNMHLFEEEEYLTHREPWSEEWNEIFGYVG